MPKWIFAVALLLAAPFVWAQVARPDGTVVSCTGSEYVKGDGSCGAGGQSAGLPSGLIVLILSGTCPTGFTQETALNGKFTLGTVAANADIGTTGGSDTITTVLNHTHPVTDPGHTHTLPVGATDDTSAPFDRADAGTNASGANATTASGSTTTGVTTSNPAGGVASIDNRPAFTKVIFCRAN